VGTWGHHGHGVTPDMEMRDPMAMGMRDTRTHGDTMAMGTPQCGDEGPHGHENMVTMGTWGHPRYGDEGPHGHGCE